MLVRNSLLVHGSHKCKWVWIALFYQLVFFITPHNVSLSNTNLRATMQWLYDSRKEELDMYGLPINITKPAVQ